MFLRCFFRILLRCEKMRAKNNTKSPSDSSWAILGANWGDYALQKSAEKSLQKTTQKKQYKIVLARLLGGLGRQDRPYNHCYYLLLLRKVAPSWLQDGSKMAPRWPKLAPRCPKMAPRLPKYGPKMAQDCPKLAQDGPKMVQDGPKRAQDGLKVAQDGFI